MPLFKALIFFFFVLWATAHSEEQKPLLGGSHVYIQGGVPLSRLSGIAPSYQLLTIALLPNGNSEEVNWKPVAQTVGGILFVGDEKNWRVGRQMFLVGDMSPPARRTFSVAIGPLRAMEDTNRSAVINLSTLRVWKVAGERDSLHAAAKKPHYLTAAGKTPYGDFYEYARISLNEGRPHCEFVLLSLATETTFALKIFADDKALVPEQIILREGVTRGEIEKGEISFSSFKAVEGR